MVYNFTSNIVCNKFSSVVFSSNYVFFNEPQKIGFISEYVSSNRKKISFEGLNKNSIPVVHFESKIFLALGFKIFKSLLLRNSIENYVLLDSKIKESKYKVVEFYSSYLPNSKKYLRMKSSYKTNGMKSLEFKSEYVAFSIQSKSFHSLIGRNNEVTTMKYISFGSSYYLPAKFGIINTPSAILTDINFVMTKGDFVDIDNTLFKTGKLFFDFISIPNIYGGISELNINTGIEVLPSYSPSGIITIPYVVSTTDEKLICYLSVEKEPMKDLYSATCLLVISRNIKSYNNVDTALDVPMEMLNMPIPSPTLNFEFPANIYTISKSVFLNIFFMSEKVDLIYNVKRTGFDTTSPLQDVFYKTVKKVTSMFKVVIPDKNSYKAEWKSVGLFDFGKLISVRYKISNSSIISYLVNPKIILKSLDKIAYIEDKIGPDYIFAKKVLFNKVNISKVAEKEKPNLINPFSQILFSVDTKYRGVVLSGDPLLNLKLHKRFFTSDVLKINNTIGCADKKYIIPEISEEVLGSGVYYHNARIDIPTEIFKNFISFSVKKEKLSIMVTTNDFYSLCCSFGKGGLLEVKEERLLSIEITNTQITAQRDTNDFLFRMRFKLVLEDTEPLYYSIAAKVVNYG